MRPSRSLLAVVLPAEPELLPRRARAELLAALRVVDYVTIAEPADLHSFEVIHLENQDRTRTAELIRKIVG